LRSLKMKGYPGFDIAKLAQLQELTLSFEYSHSISLGRLSEISKIASLKYLTIEGGHFPFDCYKNLLLHQGLETLVVTNAIHNSERYGVKIFINKKTMEVEIDPSTLSKYKLRFPNIPDTIFNMFAKDYPDILEITYRTKEKDDREPVVWKR
ncbi:MAG: hypothetical protein LLG04_11830, partial [Parachlamydia sp.]|nr:hypothetical protein [Parachlamydia sp.]